MVGKKINNYELRELVGDGAMGSVYLAEHPILRRRAAVKLLKRQYLESPVLVSRFVNEARAAAAIHHPNIIEVIDVGMLDGEVPYIMMEFLDGEPLSRRLARDRIGIGKAVDIAIQAARGVAASHALEIVHRDLKPENLFLVPDPTAPGGERVKVLDFGIAKLRPDWGGGESPKTQTGAIFGTPAYMSPEQCRGLNAEVDAKTDIYSLGCILFEMLCGRTPYVAPGWGDVLMMHMQEAIPVPSVENPRVPPALDKVVLTALAKNKGERFASMREMHRALAEARAEVGDTPVPVPRPDSDLSARQIDLTPDGRSRRVDQSSTLAPPPGRSTTAPADTAGGRRRLVVALVAAVAGSIGLFFVIARPKSRETPAAEPQTRAAAAPSPSAPPAAVPEPPAPATPVPAPDPAVEAAEAAQGSAAPKRAPEKKQSPVAPGKRKRPVARASGQAVPESGTRSKSDRSRSVPPGSVHAPAAPAKW